MVIWNRLIYGISSIYSIGRHDILNIVYDVVIIIGNIHSSLYICNRGIMLRLSIYQDTVYYKWLHMYY